MFFPMVRRLDLSITQDVFRNIKGKRNSGQFRIDFTNFGNLLNHNWGVSERFVVPTTGANGAQILTNATADAAGPRELSPGGRQRRARDQVVPDRNGAGRRVSVPSELPLYVQLRLVGRVGQVGPG